MIGAFVYVGGANFSLEDRLNTSVWRLSIWRDSLLMIKERPIFGHGINTFMRIFQDYSLFAKGGPTYAHNCFIQLTAETGLLGLGCFFFILYHIFRDSVMRIKQIEKSERDLSLIALGILSGSLAYLIQSFFDTNWYSLQLSVYFWYMIGILFSIHHLFDRIEY